MQALPGIDPATFRKRGNRLAFTASCYSIARVLLTMLLLATLLLIVLLIATVLLIVLIVATVLLIVLLIATVLLIVLIVATVLIIVLQIATMLLSCHSKNGRNNQQFLLMQNYI